MKIEFNGKFAFYLLRIKISSITICFSNCAPIYIKGPTEAVMICSDKMSSSRPYFIFGLICYFVLWHPASRAVVMALSICTLLSPLLTYTYIVHVACKTHKLIKSYLFYVHVSKESSCTTDKTNQTQDNDKKCIITFSGINLPGGDFVRKHGVPSVLRGEWICSEAWIKQHLLVTFWRCFIIIHWVGVLRCIAMTLYNCDDSYLLVPCWGRGCTGGCPCGRGAATRGAPSTGTETAATRPGSVGRTVSNTKWI